MYVKFWGTRGSIPTPLTSAAIEEKIRQALRGAAGLDLSTDAAIERYLRRLPPHVRSTTGGNTACVELRAGNQLLILDCGSGLRLLGQALMRDSFGRGQGTADIFISHTHWDHIQGLPFFTPAFVPGNRLTIHGPHADLEKAFIGQQDPLYFPVPFSGLRANIGFDYLPVGVWSEVGQVRVCSWRMSHPGECYGYRFEHNGQSMVYATDSEYQQMGPEDTQAQEAFFHGADLLIFDAQYAYPQLQDKLNWGHSSPLNGAAFARRAGVRRLVFFHHDPLADDVAIYAGQRQAETSLRDTDCQVFIASEGLVIEW